MGAPKDSVFEAARSVLLRAATVLSPGGTAVLQRAARTLEEVSGQACVSLESEAKKRYGIMRTDAKAAVRELE